MKLNWGWGITLFYSLFVIGILSLGYLSMQQQTDLVSSDYYAQELKFQDRIDDIKRTKELKGELLWQVSGDQVTMQFPEDFAGKRITGQVLFYRPSDKGLDVTLPLQPDSNGRFTAGAGQLKHGVYEMEVTWSVDNIQYYQNGVIRID